MYLLSSSEDIQENGFVTINDVFSDEEIASIISIIDQLDCSPLTFRKDAGLFAIRQFLKEAPQLVSILFNQKLKDIIKTFFGDDYFIVKSIYFNKPELSNWFVSYHQDLTISVERKADLTGFSNWTVKQGQYAVQPPLNILGNNFTIRIHLDDTDEHNGALRVIPGSHQKGVYPPQNIDWTIETESIVSLKKGGVMIMKPLLLHSSNRTTNNNKRRVIHLEFSNATLPVGVEWSEKLVLDYL